MATASMSREIREQMRVNLQANLDGRHEVFATPLDQARTLCLLDRDEIRNLETLVAEVDALASRVQRVIDARGLTLQQKPELTPSFHGMAEISWREALDAVQATNAAAARVSGGDEAAGQQVVEILKRLTRGLTVPADPT
jgi:hypothetical protein